MHPLAPDLSKLTDDELQKKRSELQSRLAFVYRMGNADLVGQISIAYTITHHQPVLQFTAFLL